MIAFGLGASLDGQVKVYEMFYGVPAELLHFKVQTDSGRMPGEMVTTGLGAAISGGTTVASAAATVGLTGIDVHRSTVQSLTNFGGEPDRRLFLTICSDPRLDQSESGGPALPATERSGCC